MFKLGVTTEKCALRVLLAINGCRLTQRRGNYSPRKLMLPMEISRNMKRTRTKGLGFTRGLSFFFIG
jgi:hypothetical protein